MEIRDARFLISNTDVAKCPKPDKPEYAFTGRSNVGKSSLINMLTNKKSLAKTSEKPGKTRLINHFVINNDWYLVDLPGYGYAKVPVTERLKWENFIREYILQRENLNCLFILVDSRHSPQKIDLDFITWVGENGIPLAIIFTKTDKLKDAEQVENIEKYKLKLLETWEELPACFTTSSHHLTGKAEILDFIEKINSQRAN